MISYLDTHINQIIFAMFIIIVVKSIIIGSEFSLINWIRYGKKYWNWYNQRETFAEYLKRSPGDIYENHRKNRT